MYAFQTAGKISKSYLDDVLNLFVSVALGVWDKALKNCATLDKSVIAATAFFFLVPIFHSGKFVFFLRFLFCQTVKLSLKLVAFGKDFFDFGFGTDKFFFVIITHATSPSFLS